MLFYNCTDLPNINIPTSVTDIGDYAFYNCISVVTSITIPEGVISIGDYVFYNCKGLTSITIPEGVTSIGNYAFSVCIGLDSINIPNSVTSIGDYAFLFCDGLTNVKVNWTTPLVVNSNIFANVSIGSIPLTIPVGTLSLYQIAAVWQDFNLFILNALDINKTPALQVYPNPVKDVLNIKLNKGIEFYNINIYNALGQFINSIEKLKINTSNLKNGIYFVEIESNQGKSTKKIIIE